MTVAIQFPSAALWHQILSGPPVGKDQGTRNPIGGFNEMVHAQLAKQNAIAGLQPPPPPQIQRPPEKESRERKRDPSRQQNDPQREQQGRDGGRQASARRDADAAIMRALWT